MHDSLKIQLKYLIFFQEPKLNLTKCEIARIGALNGDQVAVCGMKCVDLCNEAIKILGTFSSYNSRIKEECNSLKIVSNVQNMLNPRRYRNITLEERIIVFKSLAISKIIFQALIAPVHLIKAQRQFRSPSYGITLALK